MTKPTDTLIAEVLESAAMVICVPDWHTKEEFARKAKNSTGTNAENPAACCFCAIGAIRAASLLCLPSDEWSQRCSLVGSAIGALTAELHKSKPHLEIEHYNDAPATTGEMVAEKMWQAAQNLRGANGNS